jgi:hypothetical protein
LDDAVKRLFQKRSNALAKLFDHLAGPLAEAHAGAVDRLAVFDQVLNDGQVNRAGLGGHVFDAAAGLLGWGVGIGRCLNIWRTSRPSLPMNSPMTVEASTTKVVFCHRALA